MLGAIFLSLISPLLSMYFVNIQGRPKKYQKETFNLIEIRHLINNSTSRIVLFLIFLTFFVFTFIIINCSLLNDNTQFFLGKLYLNHKNISLFLQMRKENKAVEICWNNWNFFNLIIGDPTSFLFFSYLLFTPIAIRLSTAQTFKDHYSFSLITCLARMK